MKVYLANLDITSSVDFVKSDGAPFSPQSVDYSVFDENDTEIVAKTPVSNFALGDTFASVVVPASLNSLSSEKVRSSRVVKFYATMSNGNVIVFDDIYVIESHQTMIIMKNTYQTYQSAEVIAFDMQGIDMWKNEQSASVKRRALAEAFNRIGKFAFYVDNKVIDSINTMPKSEFESLSEDFVNAIKRAQVIEADVILGGDPISEKRQGGLMSETVGESSNMYRPGKPVLLPVSRGAMNALSGYIIYGANIKRA